jgi:hypothetical protein
MIVGTNTKTAARSVCTPSREPSVTFPNLSLRLTAGVQLQAHALPQGSDKLTRMFVQ